MRLPAKKIVYHSQEWDELVEQGWITARVDWYNGEYLATMLPTERTQLNSAQR